MYIYKTLYSETVGQFVHFDQSIVDDRVMFYYSDMPMIINKETEIEDLLQLFGEGTILPEGIELKEIEIKFIKTTEQTETTEN